MRSLCPRVARGDVLLFASAWQVAVPTAKALQNLTRRAPGPRRPCAGIGSPRVRLALMLLAAAVLQDDFQLQARAQPRENVATGVYDYSPGYVPLSLGPKPAAGLASAFPPPLAPCPLSSRPCHQRCPALLGGALTVP